MVANNKAKRRRDLEPLMVKQKTAARLLDVTPRQIQYWESAGLIRSETVGTTKLYPYHQFKALAGLTPKGDAAAATTTGGPDGIAR